MCDTLESKCLSRYLDWLEGECNIWVQLRSQNCSLLRNVVDKILPCLREQLSGVMSGTSSTNLRSAMMKEILSGKYPSEKYRNIIKQLPSSIDIPGGPDSTSNVPDDRINSFIDKIKSRTNKCTSMCCNGAFIVETMLLVVMNDEIKELVFDPETMKNAWKPGDIREYVPFNYPALLASYKHFITVESPCSEEFRSLRPIALEKLKIGRFDLLLSQHKGFKVLRSHSNTSEYLEFMKYLGPQWSWDSNIWEPEHVLVSACDWPGMEMRGYLPNAQHAMYALTDLFTPKWWRDATFEKLTEISLSNDFVTNFCENEGTPLFSAMGHACPNLKVLDLSGLIRLRGESILYLFFHDAFQILHEFMYIHRYRYEYDSEREYGSIYLDHTNISQVEQHSFSRYCPWCVDEGVTNWLRAGCEFNMVVFSVIDTRIWKYIEENEMSLDLIKNGLMYSVSSEDLYKSVLRPRLKLERHGEKKPYEDGYIPEPGCEMMKEYDGSELWYPPATIKYIRDSDTSIPILSPIARSLQILNLPGMSLRGEMVPFLLRACPKLKSFGHGGSIPYGLELLSQYQDEEEDLVLNLEELEIDFDYLDENDQKEIPDYDERYGTSDTLSANSPNFNFLLANFGQKIFKPEDDNDNFGEVSSKQFALRVYQEVAKYAPELNLDERIEKYVGLIVRYAKKLKRLSIFMTSTFGNDLEEDSKVWDGLLDLKNLTELELRFAKFDDVAGLIKVLGPKLKKIKTYCLPSRHGFAELMNWMMGGNNTEIEFALVICEQCPNLEELDCVSLMYNFHFGQQIKTEPGHFFNLKHINVGYITWDTLLQIWSLVINLESLKMTGIVESFTMSSLSVISLDKPKVNNLLSRNSMKKLKCIRAVKFEFTSFSSAHLFIHHLPQISTISKLIIRDDEPDVEDGMSEDEWVVWLKRRKDETGLCVNWTGKFVFEETNED